MSSLLALVSMINLIMLLFLFESIPTAGSRLSSGVASLVLSNVEVFGAVVFVFGVSGVVASLGILKKKQWGIDLTILLLAVGIVWGILVLILEVAAVGSAAHSDTPIIFLLARSIATVGISFCWIAGCAWGITRLRSAKLALS